MQCWRSQFVLPGDFDRRLQRLTVCRGSLPLLWEYGRNEKAFAYTSVKGDRSPAVAVREGVWKLLVNADGSGAELYDMAADPKEATNLAASRPEVARRLADKAVAWRKSLP